MGDPLPSADGRAHLFRACVPTCVALGRAPGRRWRGRLALGCERCRVGSTCWVHPTASESEAWFPRPLALWLLGSVGLETCGPHGRRKQHLGLPFRPPGPIFPLPRLREWGQQGGLCLYPRVLEESFPPPPGPPHSISPSLSELQPVRQAIGPAAASGCGGPGLPLGRQVHRGAGRCMCACACACM